MALHIACMLADRFGIITLPDRITPELMRRWQLVGIARERITSVRSINIPFTELMQGKDEFEARFIELAKKQVEEEGAQAIVDGCLAFGRILGPGSKEKLENVLGVPVINAAPITIKMVEMMVSLNLRHSKKAYPK